MTSEQQTRALLLLDIARETLTAEDFGQRDYFAERIREFLESVEDSERERAGL